MSAHKSPTFSKPDPSSLQSPQGKIPELEFKAGAGEIRRKRARPREPGMLMKIQVVSHSGEIYYDQY